MDDSGSKEGTASRVGAAEKGEEGEEDEERDDDIPKMRSTSSVFRPPTFFPCDRSRSLSSGTVIVESSS